ncbi:MAG TPA: hypothetical protein VMT81_03020 [Candidatus Paceibacterota bacterium]|nr:hypothetical protein [Candidatus Paceibacterota bacterium]
MLAAILIALGGMNLWMRSGKMERWGRWIVAIGTLLFFVFFTLATTK